MTELTVAELVGMRQERLALVDDVLRVLRTYEMEPAFDVQGLVVLTEYVRTGVVPPDVPDDAIAVSDVERYGAAVDTLLRTGLDR